MYQNGGNEDDEKKKKLTPLKNKIKTATRLISLVYLYRSLNA
jgi:hypothetical protein